MHATYVIILPPSTCASRDLCLGRSSRISCATNLKSILKIDCISWCSQRLALTPNFHFREIITRIAVSIHQSPKQVYLCTLYFTSADIVQEFHTILLCCFSCWDNDLIQGANGNNFTNIALFLNFNIQINSKITVGLKNLMQQTAAQIYSNAKIEESFLCSAIAWSECTGHISTMQ